MLDEKYPSENWARVYTDGSATNATTNGGAGVYIEYPNGEKQSMAFPTGLHCSNYKAEEETLLHAENYIINNAEAHENIHIAFLTDAFSVLQALTNNTTTAGKNHLLNQEPQNCRSVDTITLWNYRQRKGGQAS